MKSVFEKGSTVFKAIEKAWSAAGEPENFTIKIIDSGKKGLFGLLFAQPAIISISYKQSKRPQKHVFSRGLAKKPVIKNQPQAFRQGDCDRQDKKTPQKRAQPERKIQVDSWVQALADEVSGNLKESLDLMKVRGIFKLSINKKILNIYLQESILESKDEEKIFFISLSHLLMQVLKRKHRKKFDGFHIIINSPLTQVNVSPK